MKFKTTALLIIVSTVALIGGLNFAINGSSETTIVSQSTASAKDAEVQHEQPSGGPSSFKIKNDHQAVKPYQSKNDQDKSSPKENATAAKVSDLSPEDVKKITSVANLSDAELAKELDALRDEIEEDDLLEQLEDDDLTEEQAASVKETLERFALLGLEESRRKFMTVEPELKDALYAHRESLKEIREMLSDD